jgi:hypothetical protein
MLPDDLNPRRLAFGAVKRMLFEPSSLEGQFAAGEPRLLPPSESSTMSRSRDRILANLDDMYSEAFEAAKRAEDDAQMRSLDFAYRREQLYFEILLDIRDSMAARR